MYHNSAAQDCLNNSHINTPFKPEHSRHAPVVTTHCIWVYTNLTTTTWYTTVQFLQYN